MPERPTKPEAPLLIQGLVSELPPRDKPFPRGARDRWLNALRVNLELIYDDDDDGETPDG